MVVSLNCLILGGGSNSIFNVPIGKYYDVDGVHVAFDCLTVENLKDILFKRREIKGITEMDIWKVELDLKSLKGKIYTADDIKNLGTGMESVLKINKYFNNNDKIPEEEHLHIFILPTSTGQETVKTVTSIVFESIEELLRKAESHWTRLKDKLVKKIELEEFRVSNHIFKDSIHASGIPVINERPAFIMHSLPDSDNKEGYIPEDMFSALFKKVMKQRWLFLMGTSGSGKTRSLYELFCRTYGIYFSLNTGNGHKNNNLGSRDMDTAIADLSFSLVHSESKSLENNNIALRYTRAQ